MDTELTTTSESSYETHDMESEDEFELGSDLFSDDLGSHSTDEESEDSSSGEEDTVDPTTRESYLDMLYESFEYEDGGSQASASPPSQCKYTHVQDGHVCVWKTCTKTPS